MTTESRRILVTGAGGFIGHHLVTRLKADGHWVRGVDLKRPEYGETAADEFELLDLRRWPDCLQATRGVDEVYALAADMGGMGFISAHHAEILHNNALISTHTLEAARRNGVSRYLYTSSACIYPEYRQTDANVVPLREEEAYPAAPQDAYGWEKLVTEKLCEYYASDYGIETRIVRFHNIYGPYGTWDGGREKAPAALCRKVAQAKLTGVHEVDIWGDGEQTRSFCYIDDCVEGIYRLMRSDYGQPLNLGTDQIITINDLARMVIRISGKQDIRLRHIPGPQGVRGRNSDNTRLRQALGWEPTISLEDGLARTYAWINERVSRWRGGSCVAEAAGGSRRVIPRVDVLGVPVSAVDMQAAVAIIDGWVQSRTPHYVCVTGVHGVMESQRDEQLRAIHAGAGMVTPDGMPLVWLSHLAGQRHVQRVYGPDLLLACCEAFVARGVRHYFYGGLPGIAERLAGRLQARFPGMAVAGVLSPPFGALTPEQDAAIVEEIAASRPDIVWVGLSTPKQERWMASHVGRVGAPVLIGVGAAFDFHAGVKRQAPRWMQRSGLEWSFRLMTEPRRLGPRYLVNNPLFVWRVARQWVQGSASTHERVGQW